MAGFKWLIVAAYLLCASVASGQTWYTEWNDGGIALPVGAVLVPPVSAVVTGGVIPPQSQFPSEAHLKVAQDAAIINSNTLDVRHCQEVTVMVTSSDYTGADAEFFVKATSSVAATYSFKILADFNGDGVINETDNLPLDGDDGNDSDGDSTARQTGVIYGITGVTYLWVDQETVDTAGSGYVEVSCR